MSKSTIKVGGLVVCWVNKRCTGTYEICFPPEETLRSYYVCSPREVHQWLDAQYGAGEWVAE